MNILDVENKDLSGVDWLVDIFSRQSDLHSKYSGIEAETGIGLSLIKDVPWSIDNQKCQYIIKDYCWRVTEELTEACTAHSWEHKVEELIDALHFYTELMLMCGRLINGNDYQLLKYQNVITPTLLQVIVHLGTAANTLKQKPWKQHHFPTDTDIFYRELVKGYVMLLMVIQDEGLTEDDIHQVYYKKSEVNRFRIRSGY